MRVARGNLHTKSTTKINLKALGFKMTFTEFCEEYLDAHVALMTDGEISEARKGYALRLKEIEKESKQAAAAAAKSAKALAKAKEARKLAKFYGGKALTGSAAQKKWAEEIRQKVLESDALTDDEKMQIVSFSGTYQSAKFWINNKDKNAASFKPELLKHAMIEVNAMYEKHYNTLCRTCAVSEKNLARRELYSAIKALPLEVYFEIPNCEFYDINGILIKNLKF